MRARAMALGALAVSVVTAAQAAPVPEGKAPDGATVSVRSETAPFIELELMDAQVAFEPGAGPYVGTVESWPGGGLDEGGTPGDGLAYAAFTVHGYADYTVHAAGDLVSAQARTLPTWFQVARQGLFSASGGEGSYVPVSDTGFDGPWIAAPGVLDSGRVGPGPVRWWFRGRIERKGLADVAGDYAAAVTITFSNVSNVP